MKKFTVFFSVLIILSLFAACAGKGAADAGTSPVAPPVPSDPAPQDTQTAPPPPSSDADISQVGLPAGSSTPAEPTLPTEPATPVEPTAPSATTSSDIPWRDQGDWLLSDPSLTGDEMKITVWGDAVISTNSPIDIMCGLARAAGRETVTTTKVYDNLGETSTYNLYELFNFSDSSAQAKITSVKNTHFLWAVTNPTDCLIILSGRDRTLTTASSGQRGLTAFKEIQKAYYAANPDGKIVLLVPYPYKDTQGELGEKFKLTGYDSAGHRELIKSYAEKEAALAAGKIELAQIGDAFAFFEANYAESGIDLYDEGGIYASAAGGYYTACVLYAAVYGDSPAGLSEYGFLDKASAELLQEAAHVFVLGSAPEKKDRSNEALPHRSYEDCDPRTMKNRDPRFENEVYPEYFDELFATAYTYEAFGKAVQYDQNNMRKVSGTFERRLTQGLYPWQINPQRLSYLDCTWYCHAVYHSAFNYTVKPSVRTRVIDTREGEVFRWVGSNPDIPAEEAIEKFIKTIQPGDILVYHDHEKGWGHGMIYLGNGMLIHCSTGSHKGGGSADYNFSANIDGKEPLGGVFFAPVDILINKHTNYYCFTSAREVAVLRPLSLGIKPTEEAVARAQNLAGIVCWKETTASGGVTVNPGDDVTFTYVIRNDNGSDRVVSIKDKLPENTSFKSGDVTFENGTLDTSVTVRSHETLRLSFTVVLSESAGYGEISCGDTVIGGIRLEDFPIHVGRTLTDSEMKTLAAAADGAGDDLGLVEKAYAAIGRSLDLGSGREMIGSVCTVAADGSSFAVGSGALRALLVQNVFGGRAYGGDFYGDRIRCVTPDNCLCGDLLCVMKDAETLKVYLCVGDGVFKTVENGETVTVSRANAVDLTEKLLGEFGFFLLRPSLGF